MLNGNSKKEIPYLRIISGAIARMDSVGVIKMRTKAFGTDSASAVHITPNTAAVSSAYLRI